MVTHGVCTSALVLLVHELYFAWEEDDINENNNGSRAELRDLEPMLRNPDDFVIWTNAIKISSEVSV